jgi:hypothetical protein
MSDCITSFGLPDKESTKELVADNVQIMVIAFMPRACLINVEIISSIHTSFKYGLLLYRICVALFLGQYV